MDGKTIRKALPRRSLGELRLPPRRNPIAILRRQNRSRLPELVPVRIGRMAESPFAFYRGTAAVMAADLKNSAVTGLDVVACGDAHVSNFGFFASPERSLLFDLNDFDEASTGPWEWDLKRLTASIHVGGRSIGMSEARCKDATQRAVLAYADIATRAAGMTALERFYATVDSSEVEQILHGKTTRKAVDKARTRTSARLLGKLAMRSEDGDGLRIIDQPPITQHVDHANVEELDAVFRRYLSTLREDSAYMLTQFRLVDYVLRVVGVGSVGTRCYVLAYEGPAGEVLFLQVKEAQPSVLVTYGGRTRSVPSAPAVEAFSEGHRVVAAQRVLQSHSDPFLGHISSFAGEQRRRRRRVDYFWRQFHDMKGSIDPSLLKPSEFETYGALCARLLARAHAQSPAITAIAQYVGRGEPLAEALSEWSAAYADVCEADFAQLQQAISAGDLPAEIGV